MKKTYQFKVALTGLALILTEPFGTAGNKKENQKDDNPNIIIIVADDMGWSDVGYHGSPIKTPNIDKLASQGVELNQHYVSPVCTPTRTSLLTGRYCSRFGNNAPSNERVLPWDTWTLARALQEANYTTYISGKWHLGSKAEWGPRKFGFDYSYGSLAGGVHPYNHQYKFKPYMETWHRNDTLIEEEGHVTDLLGAEVIKFIEEEHPNPFFIYFPFTAVHDPFDEPQTWLESASHIEPERRQYAACTQHMDATIGKVMDALNRTGQRENTIIIFFSDNGGTNGDGSLNYPGGKDNAPIKGLNYPLRGWKGQLYEGGIRVPAFIYWPKVLKPQKINTPVHVVDWMPTICSLLDIEATKDIKWDGMDIWPLLTGENNPQLSHREFYFQGPGRKSAALRQGNWKLIVQRNDSLDKVELYDLSADPYEKNDLSDDQPEILTKMLRAMLIQNMRDNDAVPTDINLDY